MKKFRMISSIVLLASVILLLCFGVYSIIKGNTGISNHTDFISGDEHVFVKVDCSYFGPDLVSEGAVAHKTYELNKDNPDSYKDGPVNLDSWYLGETNFTEQDNIIELKFIFTNLNDKSGLKINISDLAFDQSQRFSTSYKKASSEEELQSSSKYEISHSNGNSPETANIPEIKIGANETIYVNLIFELNNYSRAFNFNNNIRIDFLTDVPENIE